MEKQLLFNDASSQDFFNYILNSIWLDKKS